MAVAVLAVFMGVLLPALSGAVRVRVRRPVRPGRVGPWPFDADSLPRRPPSRQTGFRAFFPLRGNRAARKKSSPPKGGNGPKNHSSEKIFSATLYSPSGSSERELLFASSVPATFRPAFCTAPKGAAVVLRMISPQRGLHSFRRSAFRRPAPKGLFSAAAFSAPLGAAACWQSHAGQNDSAPSGLAPSARRPGAVALSPFRGCGVLGESRRAK